MHEEKQWQQQENRLHAAALRRVMIVGSSGSGKSTLARSLGQTLALPVHHLDAHYWLPGWAARPHEAFRARQEVLVSAERWVIDGNYRSTMDIRLPRADSVILIDVSRLLAVWRIIRRRWTYRGRTRPDLPPNCPEQVDWAFVKWTWSFPGEKRADIVRRVGEWEHLRLIVLPGRRGVRRFQQLLAARGAAADLTPFLPAHRRGER